MKRFQIAIIETLKLTVEVEADDMQQAKMLVSDKWRNSEHILNADNFAGVEFEASQIDE